nr:DUF3383 family protein [Metabacillus litoralis]
MAFKVLNQTPKVESLAIHGFLYDAAIDAPSALTDVLNTLIKTHNDFFYVLSTEQGIEEIVALDQWANTQNKFFVTVVNSETLLSQVTGKNTIAFVHETPSDYADAALVGRISPLEIGSYTVTFKSLEGVPVSQFDNDKVNAIEEAGGIAYIRVGGSNIVSKGQTVAGEYIDILQGQYFLESRMSENIYGLLVRSPKIPFTTNGIGLVVAEVEKTLKSGAASGIIATDENGNAQYSIEIPDINAISTNDKANRSLSGIKWSATIAGAIEDVDIKGTLQL